MKEEHVQSFSRQERRERKLEMTQAEAAAHLKGEMKKKRKKEAEAAMTAAAVGSAATGAACNFATSTNVKEERKEKSLGKDLRRNQCSGEVGAAFCSALQDILGASPVRGGTNEAAAAATASTSSPASLASSSPSRARRAAANAAPPPVAGAAPYTVAATTGGGRRDVRAAVLRERPGIFAALAKTQHAAAEAKRAILERRKRREAAHVKLVAADAEYERELRTIATKGVVRFLSAVMKFRRQQAKGKKDFKMERRRKFQIRKKNRTLHRTS